VHQAPSSTHPAAGDVGMGVTAVGMGVAIVGVGVASDSYKSTGACACKVQFGTVLQPQF